VVGGRHHCPWYSISLSKKTFVQNKPTHFDWTATTTNAAVSSIAQYLADSIPGLTVSVFDLAFPASHPEIISSFRDHLRSLTQNRSFVPGKSRQIVAIVDSIVSLPGALLPWIQMVDICREEVSWFCQYEHRAK
jgi:hypothetical protein